MLSNKYEFTERLEKFIQAPTETDYFYIRNHLKSKISELDATAWLYKVVAANELYFKYENDVKIEHIPLLLLLSIAKELGAGLEASIQDSAIILGTITYLARHPEKENKACTSQPDKLQVTGQVDKKDEIKNNHINSLLGFIYFLRGHRLLDLRQIREATHSFELAVVQGYKPAYNSLGILHCRLQKWDMALNYFELAFEEGNYAEALAKIGYIYIKYGENVSALNTFCLNTRIQLGIQKLREANARGVNIEKEILALYKLFPKSIRLLYQAAIIVKDKKAIEKIKNYIQAKKENAAEVFGIIAENKDNLVDINKILSTKGKTANLLSSHIPKLREYKAVSSEMILKEFQIEFAKRKQDAIRNLINSGGQENECFLVFLEEFKAGDPKLLFQHNPLPKAFPDSSREAGNPNVIKKAEAKLQILKKEKQEFIEKALAENKMKKQPVAQKDLQETADAKYQGRIENEQSVIDLHVNKTRQQQLDYLLLFIDEFTKEMLDYALDKNIPALFINKIEELSAVFHYYQNKYLAARDCEFFAKYEKFYGKYNVPQTLFLAAEQFTGKPNLDLKEHASSPPEKSNGFPFKNLVL